MQTDLGEAVLDKASGNWRLVAGEESLTEAPVALAPWPRAAYPEATPTLILNTHRNCELRCRYCFAHLAEGDYAQPPMPLDTVAQALEFLCTDLGKDAPAVVIRSTLLGEPELDPVFTEALGALAREAGARYGKRVEWHWAATTNLVKLPPEEVLRRLSWLTVSIDGPPDVQDRMRVFPDGRGSYQLVARNVAALLANTVNPSGPFLTANATLTALAPDVTRIFQHLYEMGFGCIDISPVRLPPGRPGVIDLDSVEAVKAGYMEFAGFLLVQDPDQMLSYLRRLLQPWDFLGRFLQRALRPGRVPYRCEAGKWSLAVDAAGDLYPCSAFAALRSYRMGSVRDGLTSEARRLWADDLFIENRESCVGCSARDECGGGCYHQAVLTNGRPDQPDLALCELTRHVVSLTHQMVARLHADLPEVLEAIPESRVTATPSPQTVRCVARPAEAGEAWRSPYPLLLCDRSLVRWKRWRGPDDLSAEVHLSWDRDHLQVRALVTDDTFVPPPAGARFRQGDSFEVALYPLPVPRMRYGIWAGLVEGVPRLATYHAGLQEGAPSVPWTSAGECRITREGSLTEYRLSLPWSELGELRAGQPFGLSVCVNDDDGRARGSLGWPGNAAYATVEMTWGEEGGRGCGAGEPAAGGGTRGA